MSNYVITVPKILLDDNSFMYPDAKRYLDKLYSFLRCSNEQRASLLSPILDESFLHRLYFFRAINNKGGIKNIFPECITTDVQWKDQDVAIMVYVCMLNGNNASEVLSNAMGVDFTNVLFVLTGLLAGHKEFEWQDVMGAFAGYVGPATIKDIWNYFSYLRFTLGVQITNREFEFKNRENKEHKKIPVARENMWLLTIDYSKVYTLDENIELLISNPSLDIQKRALEALIEKLNCGELKPRDYQSICNRLYQSKYFHYIKTRLVNPLKIFNEIMDSLQYDSSWMEIRLISMLNYLLDIRTPPASLAWLFYEYSDIGQATQYLINSRVMVKK